jgi:uncharacterized protein DUF6058
MEGTSPFRILTDVRDIAYARSQFRSIRGADPALPAPAYWDRDANAYVPHDYEVQESDFERFFTRARTEISRLGAPYDSQWIDDAWKNYWDGIYGICLKSATPEHIVRKNVLIDRIESMLEDAETCDERRIVLLRAVDELDALERPFCDFDRRYFGRPVSRDVYIEAVRRRYVTKVARSSPRAELPT